MITAHTTASLQAFVDKHHVPGNAALVATGVDHEDLMNVLAYGEDVPKAASEPVKPAPAVYMGGRDMRVKTGSPLVSLAVAVESAGLASVDLPAAALLQHVLGAGSNIKYSTGASPLSKLLAGAASGPHAAQAFNLSYTDTGLLGASVMCQAADAAKVLETLVKGLPGLAITESDLARAKAQLRASVLYAAEDPSARALDVAGSLLRGAGPDAGGAALLAAAQAVTLEELQAVAKRLFSKKACVGLKGDTSAVPFIDQLQ